MTDGAPRSETLLRGITEVWNRFLPRFVERVEVLERTVVAVLEGRLDPELRRQAEREAHKLAGSLGTLGSAEGTRLARSIELLLAGDAALVGSAPLRLSEWVVALRKELDRRPTSPTPEPHRAELLIVSGDAQLAERIDLEAAARGFATRRHDPDESAEAAFDGAQPAAVVLDLGTVALASGGERLALLTEGPAPPPVVILSATDDLEERLAWSGRAAATFLPPSATTLQIVEAVERALLRRSSAGARLLAVDDDPVMRPLLRALLVGRGLEVQVVADAEAFWREMERAPPDVVLLDLDMPRHDGLELCRAIRADVRWSHLPVLFLTGRKDPQAVQAVYSAGGDDFIAKPVVGPELLMRIENRLARAALQGAAQANTGPGGLPARERTREDITRMLQLAVRARVAVSLARIRLDPLPPADSPGGARVQDEQRKHAAKLLRSVVSAGDAAGWWGGDDLLLAMFATGRDEALHRLSGVADKLRAGAGSMPGLRLAAGVAEYPGDAKDLPGLVAAAEQALTDALTAGRVAAGTGPEQPPATTAELVDVAVVEDDPVLAELLLHALGVQGYSTRWIADGLSATDLLAGSRPRLRARAILLDVDLPVRDGLSVLRVLSETGIVSRSRVLVLTVRSTEREVLQALELGAADHIAKPFSVPVLLRRIRTHLERG